jgi:hypothetical protein
MADAMNGKLKPPPGVKMPARFLFLKGLGGPKTSKDAATLFNSHAEKLQQCVQSAAEGGSVVPSADQLKELIKKVREQATKEASDKFEQLVSQAFRSHATISPIVKGVMHLPTQINLIKQSVKTCSGKRAQTICEFVYEEAKGASGPTVAGAAAAAALKSCHVTIDADLTFSPPKNKGAGQMAPAVMKAPQTNQKCSTTSFVTNYLTGRVRNITAAVSQATGDNPNVEGKVSGIKMSGTKAAPRTQRLAVSQGTPLKPTSHATILDLTNDADEDAGAGGGGDGGGGSGIIIKQEGSTSSSSSSSSSSSNSRCGGGGGGGIKEERGESSSSSSSSSSSTTSSSENYITTLVKEITHFTPPSGADTDGCYNRIFAAIKAFWQGRCATRVRAVHHGRPEVRAGVQPQERLAQQHQHGSKRHRHGLRHPYCGQERYQHHEFPHASRRLLVGGPAILYGRWQYVEDRTKQ